MTHLSPVSAVIRTRNPDTGRLASTVSSLVRQTQPPAHLVVIDASDGGPSFGTNRAKMNGCACGDPVGMALSSLEERGARVDVVHLPPGHPRVDDRPDPQTAIDHAAFGHVLDLPEDGALGRDDHIERELQAVESNIASGDISISDSEVVVLSAGSGDSGSSDGGVGFPVDVIVGSAGGAVAGVMANRVADFLMDRFTDGV